MKLNKNFLVHQTGDDTVIVPVGNAGFSGVVKGNKTFGTLLELLKEDTTIEKIITAMTKKYDASPDKIKEDVVNTIERLKKIGAIDE